MRDDLFEECGSAPRGLDDGLIEARGQWGHDEDEDEDGEHGRLPRPDELRQLFAEVHPPMHRITRGAIPRPASVDLA